MSMMVSICVLLSMVEQYIKFCRCVEGEGVIVLVGQKGDAFHDDAKLLLVVNSRPVTLRNHLRPSGMMYCLRKG